MNIGTLYYTIFNVIVGLFTVVVASRLSNKDYTFLAYKRDNSIVALVLCVAFAIFLGNRPPTYIFADTGNYAHVFNMYKMGLLSPDSNVGEWVWVSFTNICTQIMDVSEYLTLIAIGYFGFTYLACRMLTPKTTLVMTLFVLGSFSFYSYATNGIRNGLACSIALAAITFVSKSRKTLIIGAILGFLAINIHKSAVLPLASLFASIYVVKQFKWAYIFWLSSIFISLVAGSAVTNFFVGLEFDDRLAYYTSGQNLAQFSSTGFRWDFLIYSMMPIILGYYVIIKKGIQDRTYNILINTYILANAFWIMVIRASFSNRFAYLSWFMYPIVLAYPLLKLDIWGSKQGKVLSQIMIGQFALTIFLDLL